MWKPEKRAFMHGCAGQEDEWKSSTNHAGPILCRSIARAGSQARAVVHGWCTGAARLCTVNFEWEPTEVILLAMARKITSCTFIARSIAAFV